jgi:hypothetical protein
VHDRLVVQDYRADIWREEKRAAAELDRQRAAHKAVVDESAEMQHWRTQALKREEGLAMERGKARAQQERRDKEEADDQMKDLRRSMRHLEGTYKRAREKKEAAAAELASAEKRVRGELKAMAAAEAEQREHQRLWDIAEEVRLAALRKAGRRRVRKKRAKPAAAEMDPQEAIRRKLEAAARARLLLANTARLRELVAPLFAKRELPAYRRAVDRWRANVQLMRLSVVMGRWFKKLDTDLLESGFRRWRGAYERMRGEERRWQMQQVAEAEARRRKYMDSFYGACSVGGAGVNAARVVHYQWEHGPGGAGAGAGAGGGLGASRSLGAMGGSGARSKKPGGRRKNAGRL